MRLRLNIALLLCLAATSHGQTNGPGMASTVAGYRKITTPKGLNLVRVDFLALSNGTYTAGSLVGQQLPANSSVSIYDRVTRAYVTETNDPMVGWPTGTGAHPIATTVGFWLIVPAIAVSNAYQVYFSGLVPDAITGPTATVQNIAASNSTLAGYGYPVTVLWTNTRLVQTTQAASLSVWNVTNQAYDTYNKSRSGWGAASNLVIKPGASFWFSVGSITQAWVETKPYTWP